LRLGLKRRPPGNGQKEKRPKALCKSWGKRGHEPGGRKFEYSVDDPEKAEKSGYTFAPPSPLGSAHNLSI
jgi:hypothetical protein